MRYPVTIQQVGQISVVRDDLIPGGSKQRILSPLMEQLANQGYRRFVFGGPAEGYAQLALAYAAQETGLQATYFVAERKQLHLNTIKAIDAGCDIRQVKHGRLNVVQARARQFCAETGSYFFPLGFSTPEFEAMLTAEVTEALAPHNPTQIWCVAGSGLLSRCLQAAKPNIPVYAVRIGFEPKTANAHLYHAPETFAQPAEIKPPFPSSENYDAKAWRFIQQHAKPGALFWNVGA
jgi:1-aminocyclopropane-1-carboxylate deaminase/D-cysteine desulfhydrase-like pyridoxal-dependent ACC family enzyme